MDARMFVGTCVCAVTPDPDWVRKQFPSALADNQHAASPAVPVPVTVPVPAGALPMVLTFQFVPSKHMTIGRLAGTSPDAKAVPSHFWTGSAPDAFTLTVSAPVLVVVVR